MSTSRNQMIVEDNLGDRSFKGVFSVLYHDPNTTRLESTAIQVVVLVHDATCCYVVTETINNLLQC
jgi:hypothetical protein